MIKWVLDALSPQVDALLISANCNIERYTTLNYLVISDSVPARGPLAGIASALKVIKTDYLVTAPCDGPCLPPDLVIRLYDAMRVQDRPLACVHDGGRLQPAYLLMHQNVLHKLPAYLERGQFKVQDWVESLDYAKADFSDRADAFENVNTPVDLCRIEARFEKNSRAG